MYRYIDNTHIYIHICIYIGICAQFVCDFNLEKGIKISNKHVIVHKLRLLLI